MSLFDQRGTGTLISRMLSDVGVINELLSQGIVTMAGDIIMVISVSIVMIALNAPLALLSLSVLPVMALSAYLFGKKARAAFRRTREKVSVLTGRLAEDINAMRVIEAFAQEDRMSREFDQINRDNRDANVAAVALSSFFTPAMEVLSVIATCIILWVGGRAVAGGTLTLGVIVAFLTYTARLFQPVLDLSMVFTTWQAAMAGGERIFEILDLEPDVKDAPNAKPLEAVRGHIVFDHVDFEYV
ncbi:MAG: ABC transporter ATP-binding protein, partial [Chloroflexi bacterium]|nr:ABC transporter ATP-binding protein [Chloroflexota bacterium]